MATKIMSKVIIRTAVEADIPELAQFIRPFVEDGHLLPRTIDELGELIPSFFIADMDGRIVGCAALEIYSPKLAEIRSLAVDPNARGHGIGKLLVEACLARAREQNVFEVMAITTTDGFFKACGFDYTLPGMKRAVFMQMRDKH